MDNYVFTVITEQLKILHSNVNRISEVTNNLLPDGAASGNILTFDGENWVASSASSAGAQSAAQSTADSAASAASQAQTTANSAQTTANSAQSTANSAQSAASVAQGTADGAVADAAAADEKADAAQSTADGAQSAADAAQSTANSAQSAADAAQSTANSAQNDITALQNASGTSGPFTETSGNDWENTGTSANQIILKHTSNQFRGINFVDNSNNGDAGLRWWKNSIGSSNTYLTQGGTQKAEIFMGDAQANWQFHNWHGDGNNHGNTDFYGGGDGNISGANSHRPILRISPSHPTTDTDTSLRTSQRYTDVAYWSANKWGKVMIGAKDNHTNITRPTFALDVRGECNIGDTAGDTQNSDGGTCSYRIGSKIVVPALGNAGEVLTVNSGGTAAEWATGGGMTPVYAKQYLALAAESFPSFSTYYVFGNFRTASSRLAIAFESPSGLGLVHSPHGNTSGGDPKNGYFKIPTGHAGLYNIHVALSFQLNHRTARIKIYRKPVGGSAGVIIEADNTLTDDHDNHFLYNVHGIEQLADGDILHVECYTYSSSSATVNLHGRETKNFFEIFKIA